VGRFRERGQRVSSMHIRYVYPLPLGLADIFSRFKRVLTIEMNYSDPIEGFDGVPGRPAQLARILRSDTMMEIDYWSLTWGQPLTPAQIEEIISGRLEKINATTEMASVEG